MCVSSRILPGCAGVTTATGKRCGHLCDKSTWADQVHRLLYCCQRNIHQTPPCHGSLCYQSGKSTRILKKEKNSNKSLIFVWLWKKNLNSFFFSLKYKFLKKEGEPHVKIEGKDTEDWICIDFGGWNIEGIILNFPQNKRWLNQVGFSFLSSGSMVVHFMLPETRETYELEKLWTLRSFDEQLKNIPSDTLPDDFIYGDADVLKWHWNKDELSCPALISFAANLQWDRLVTYSSVCLFFCFKKHIYFFKQLVLFLMSPCLLWVGKCL